LKFVAAAEIYAKTIQNRLLAAINRGLIDTHCNGYFGVSVFLPNNRYIDV
jgi:hypothetical protein